MAFGKTAGHFRTSYVPLFEGLLPGVTGACLWDAGLVVQSCTGTLTGSDVEALPGVLAWRAPDAKASPALVTLADGSALIALPLLSSRKALLGAIGLALPLDRAQALGAAPAERAAQTLKPALDCLHRELLAGRPDKGRNATAADRTEELEWLFSISNDLKREGGDSSELERLLIAATERLGCALGTLAIPDKEVNIHHAPDPATAEPLLDLFRRTRKQLVRWAQRREKALLINVARRLHESLPPCKLLCVPISASSGRVIGVLAFLNPPEGSGFPGRQVFLARHVARQMTHLLEAQFDLMTGLYTRAALEQRSEQLAEAAPSAPRAVLCIDIDGLHIVNEVHGFELGDELIVRVADILSSPIVPPSALVGRMSGDRFTVVLEGCTPKGAAELAASVQAAVSQVRIGPPEEPLTVSISCGIAALVCMPKGFARALAAAEIACKAAKDRGRNRIELYTCEDTSMMRRHDDVIVVGQLRDAIKAERLLLYAQPIVALKNERRLNGFEVLVRMQAPDGTISPPADFISAAQRYQLLPTIDRYVVKRALQTAGPFRGLLRELGASISINVSGQSVGDESFIDYVLAEVRRSGMAPGLITCEITEQTAIDGLGRTADLMKRLRQAGFRVALDDFGTGANTLAYLKGLPATRIKIDGSFVRDLPENPRSEAMIRAIRTLAHQFGMDTVAEYVESEVLARRLETLGVDFGQGYTFGKPAPFEQVLRGLRDAESQRLRALWLREA